MKSDLSEHYCCVQKSHGESLSSYLYEHRNYFPIAQIYKLFLVLIHNGLKLEIRHKKFMIHAVDICTINFYVTYEK
jgi:hypothetical protein